MGKRIFSKSYIVLIQRPITLYATSAFMECKIGALSPKNLSVYTISAANTEIWFAWSMRWIPARPRRRNQDPGLPQQ